jgi:hypothetical protein
LSEAVVRFPAKNERVGLATGGQLLLDVQPFNCDGNRWGFDTQWLQKAILVSQLTKHL